MSLSANTIAALDRVKVRFATGAKPVDFAENDICQYNITDDGTVVRTIVFNLKDFKFIEGAATNDVEITVDDADVPALFAGKLSLVDLHSSVNFNCVNCEY